MTKGSGKGLVQLWPSEKDSYACRADGALIRGLRNDLGALAPCPDAALPLPSDPFSIVIDLTPNAHPALLADNPTPKSLLRACARKLALRESFEGGGPLPGDIVIRYLTSPDLPSVLKAEERTPNAGVSYLAILIRFPDLLIGPLSSPQFPNLYRHLEARITAVSLASGAISTTLRPPALDLIRDHLKEFPGRLLDVKTSSIRNKDAKSSLNWTTIDIPSARKRTRVLVPWLTWRGYEHAPEIIDIHSRAFCDKLVGIVTRLRTIDHNEALPKCVITIQSGVTDIRVISEWSNNTVCQGGAIEDEGKAHRAAVGEAIERYCVNVIDSEPTVTGSYDDLFSSGHTPVPPESFILFSPRQCVQAGFRFTPFTPHIRIPWMPVRNFTCQRDDSVPPSMVYVNHNQKGTIHGEPFSSFPRVAPISYAGIAVGHDFEGALFNGLKEIIERDATMIWWHSEPMINPVSIESSKVVETVDRFLAKGFDLSFFIPPNEFHIPVVTAVLRNDHHRTCSTGFSCRPSTEAAAFKAITEAATLFDGTIDPLDPAGRMFSAIERLELSPNMALPYRQDRIYLDTIEWSYDFVHDLMIQQQLNLDPRAHEHRSPYLGRPIVPITRYPVDEEESHASAYHRNKLEAAGYEILAADVTTPGIRACSGIMLRVLVPGLVPNFPAGDITFGGGRILNTYHRAGLHSAPQSPDQFNRFPLPHA